MHRIGVDTTPAAARAARAARAPRPSAIAPEWTTPPTTTPCAPSAWTGRWRL
jgi:hypothetical protein